MKKYNLHLLIALCMILFVSCQKEEIESVTERVYSDDFYSFADESEFSQIFKNDISLSGFDISFTTQYDIYQKALLEDEKYQAYLETLSPDKLNALKKEKGNYFAYSEYTMQHKHLFKFDERPEYFMYELAVASYEPAIIHFLNQDGIVQIGDSVKRYTRNGVINAHLSDLNEILNIDPKIFDGKLNIKEYSLGRTSNSAYECETYSGNSGVEGIAVWAIYPSFNYLGTTGSGLWYGKVRVFFRSTSYKKNWLGWSKKRAYETAITNQTINIPYFLYHPSGEHQEIYYYVLQTDYLYWPDYPNYILTFHYDEVRFRGRSNVQCIIYNP